ncbi:virulence factor SrfC family protein [Pseudomonas sp. RP23018S]|uniref:virulence factor SrfC family protein n=1 Tax=Pseudomonas sp. RP23018S TaxID=3096037 RepID=UPI002ACA23FC|nr:virulence factor SrfC family protein [Pseudomonas sp. RP23018S]MDZ5602471.1 virulence factor SrfC family protein [Pseudomonas sp. RP23018S]
MSKMTSQHAPEQLARGWHNLHQGAGLALDWIASVAPAVDDIARLAPGLNRELHRARNLSSSLQRVSTTPMTAGFFGLSQAGKSYLISALAADSQGRLDTRFGERNLGFIEHVNPVGSGTEATGLVTRFTRHATPSPDSAYPVELRLFKEIEIAIILANSWFEDFDHQKIDSAFTEARIDAALAPYADLAVASAVPGVTGDDVVRLWDYLEKHYSLPVQPLAARYWPRVLEIAPQLNVRERARLLGPLWGNLEPMIKLYEQLANALHGLGLAQTVRAPLQVLVSEHDGELVQRNNIMNVDTLPLLGTAKDSPLQVRPLLPDGTLGAPASVTTAQLAALSNELIFGLMNTPANDIVNEVDLLDFPGYRSREKLLQLPASGEDLMPRLFLRGKVAYLFQRYSTEQEMNALVMCTSTALQSEVVNVGTVLQDWIERTQGATPQQRDGKAPGLLWALTMCDLFVTTALNGYRTQYTESCANLLKRTVLERFGNESWMRDWGSRPFNNMCLVRKPRREVTFIELSSKAADGTYQELGIKEDKKADLEVLKSTFLDNPLVHRHLAEPVAAWDAMLAVNDGGLSFFCDGFVKATSLHRKLDHIAEQYDDLLAQLLPRLERYYQAGGEDERKKKKELANRIAGPFVREVQRKQVLGELLAYMAVPETALRELYLSGDFESAAAASTDAAEAAPAHDDFDIFGEPEEAAPASHVAQYQSHEHRFARAAFDLWAAHLRSLSCRAYVLELLDLPADTVASLVNELIICAERLELPQQLSEALLRRAQSGVRRESLVQRQILTAQLMLNDFSAWFGHLGQPLGQRPNSLLGGREPLFACYQRPLPGRFPELAAQAEDQAVTFADHWVSGIAIHTQDNAGHRKGMAISPEQNEQLGRVLNTLKAR